jgi:hypothetical protein
MTTVVNPREVTLPVGVRMNGSVYRKVWIDEMRAIDHRNSADRAVRANGGKTLTSLLRRCVQEIEGLLERKEKPMEMFPEAVFRKMTTVDRDFLLVQIRQTSREPRLTHGSPCPSCGAMNEETVLLDDLEMYDWPDEKETEIEIDLSEVGAVTVQGNLYDRMFFTFASGAAQEAMSNVKEEDRIFALIASQVRLPDGVRVSQTDVLPWSDTVIAEIMEQVAEGLPGYDLRRSFQCSSCGTEYDVGLDLTRFFHNAQVQKRLRKPGGTTGRIKRTKTG